MGHQALLHWTVSTDTMVSKILAEWPWLIRRTCILSFVVISLSFSSHSLRGTRADQTSAICSANIAHRAGREGETCFVTELCWENGLVTCHICDTMTSFLLPDDPCAQLVLWVDIIEERQILQGWHDVVDPTSVPTSDQTLLGHDIGDLFLGGGRSAELCKNVIINSVGGGTEIGWRFWQKLCLPSWLLDAAIQRASLGEWTGLIWLQHLGPGWNISW